MNEKLTAKPITPENSAANDEPQPIEITLSVRTIVRIVLLVLLILFVVSAAQTIVSDLSFLLLIIVFAIFFAYLVAPLVEIVRKPFVSRNRAGWMPRPVAIAVVYLFLFLGLYGVINYIAPLVSAQVSQFAQQLPTYSSHLRARFEEINRRYERTAIPQGVRDSIEKNLESLGETASGYLQSAVGAVALGAFTVLPAIILIPILGFFFLKDAELLKLAAVRAFPRGRWRGRAELFLGDLNKTLRAYIRAQIISCALIGVICAVGFYLIGVPYSLLLGLVAAVLEFIPLAGPLTVGLLATLIASFYSWQHAVAVAIFLLILRMLQDYVFYPRIIREGIHLHPLAIILAVLAGGEIGGVTGIFLAIPVVAVSTVVYRHSMEHSGSAGIVAELLDEGKTEQAVDVAKQQLKEIHQTAKKELRPENT
jgi:predicted PurR-regulated permease PerM